ncbi:MAG: RnfABCDGE type electron transport complex subunit B [Deltaproteobacteria bacterium]
MANLLIPISILGGLGVLFGLSLAYAARKFHVPVDPRLEHIIRSLPGANCGACGRAGCMGFAQALLQGELNVASCSVMAQENKQGLAEYLGLSLEEKEKKVACLHCNGGNRAKDKFLYDGMKDCLSVSLLLGGQKECAYGCLTYGTCVRACPFGAIELTGEGYPRVNEDKCTACGVCVTVCPKKLYDLIPADKKTAAIYVACMSRDMGKRVMDACGAGCIACRKCEKACPHGAMKVVDNLARVDYALCNGCAACVKVCPTKVIKVRGETS